MSKPSDKSPDSDRVEFAPEGDGVYVFLPCCHGARVHVPLGEAVPGARPRLVCPRCGVAWLPSLVADDETECGVRALWTDLSVEGGPS